MDERKLAEEWGAMRRRSMRAFPIAVVMAVVLGGVVYVEELYRSDAAFLIGVLVGSIGYWAVLEAMTILRVGRLLREAEATRVDADSADGPAAA